MITPRLFSIFRREAGAGAFFLSILVWGIGVGCFAAAMNNFLSDLYGMNGMDRGWLEFFRELPGLLLVFILALLHRVSDWRVMRIGSLISLAGAALLLIPSDKIFVTATIMIWSMGEHLVMPVRSAIATFSLLARTRFSKCLRPFVRLDPQSCCSIKMVPVESMIWLV